MADDLTSLISRLEAATDEQVCDADWLREVRTAIADACFDRAKPEAFSEPHWWFQGFIGWQPLEDAPDWLFSIDAAKTLVPTGMFWSVGTWSGNFATCGNQDWSIDTRAEGHANTAICLCIASLKARAKLSEARHD